jgi:putative phage-type endonuclease
MKKHIKPTHGSQEWLELRHRIDGKCVIGASEVPSLLGVSPYKTRADLYIAKMTPVEVGEPTAAMRRGTLLEPSLIDFAIEELNQHIIVPDEMFQNQRIIATLDGITADGETIVEAKTTNSWMDGAPLPIEFILQAQAQMYASGFEHVTFAILDRNLRLSLTEVERDESIIDQIEREARIFGEMIDANAPFDSLGSFTLPQIASLYPKPAGEVELDSSVVDLLIEWNAIKDQAKVLDAQEKAIKDQLANALGEAEFGIVNGERVVSFKAQAQTRVDTARLKKEKPDIIEAYSTASSFRVLRAMI